MGRTRFSWGAFLDFYTGIIFIRNFYFLDLFFADMANVSP